MQYFMHCIYETVIIFFFNFLLTHDTCIIKNKIYCEIPSIALLLLMTFLRNGNLRNCSLMVKQTIKWIILSQYLLAFFLIQTMLEPPKKTHKISWMRQSQNIFLSHKILIFQKVNISHVTISILLVQRYSKFNFNLKFLLQWINRNKKKLI